MSIQGEEGQCCEDQAHRKKRKKGGAWERLDENQYM
jgi:hypothetical protein